MTYREFLIPKKGSGFRKITAPDDELLAYQRSLLTPLESLWQDIASDHDIDHIQHGFIKNRNCVTAAERHVGFRTTISMDIADFFDTVTSDMISKFSSTYGSDSRLYHADGYCSQGFATSPILCNIALIPAIFAIEEYLWSIEDDFAFTVYADDVTISVNEENYENLNTIIAKIQKIMESHGFKIKPSKTRIRYAKFGYRRILGIMVGNDHIKVPRKVKYKLRAARHQNNGPSIGGLTTWSKLMLPKAYR